MNRIGFVYPCALGCAVLVLSATVARPANTSKYSFTALGDLPGGDFESEAYGVSRDGIVVGVGNSPAREAFRWTRDGGLVGLGYLSFGFVSGSAAISEDGSTIVGYSDSASGYQAIRATDAAGMVGLGDLPGGAADSSARATSFDGSVVVGRGTSSFGPEAFRWTGDGGMVGLGDLPGGPFYSAATGVSADGSIVVGYGRSSSGFQAFRWTAESGMVGLGDLPGGGSSSYAFAVSPDGLVVVGQGSPSGVDSEAFLWTSANGMVRLGQLPGGVGFNSVATSVSAGGAVVVGRGTLSVKEVGHTRISTEAFLWTAEEGMVNLRVYLSTHGVNNLSGWSLYEATAITADGRTVVGYGYNPLGEKEAWIATIPEPSTLLLCLFALAAAVLVRRRGI